MSDEPFKLGEEIRVKGRAFSHDRVENTKHEWLTPPLLVKALGPFDLDPCAPVPEKRPWATAAKHYDIRDNGLIQPWAGRVWCNPPYENDIAGKFLARLADHNNGIALIYARTETQNWFDYIWPKATAIFFIRGRLTFFHVDGTPAANGGGAPSALIAYGGENLAAIQRQTYVKGHLVLP